MLSLSRRNVIAGLVLLAAGLTVAMASRSTPESKAPLAIQGYDPVAYFTTGKPARGLTEIEYV